MHQEALEQNLEQLHYLETKANVKILHTLKSFNKSSITPLISNKISGMSVSSLKEIKMAEQAEAKHLHLYAPAFKEEDFIEASQKVHTLSLNSLSQWKRFAHLASKSSLGLRINPKLFLPIPDYCNPNLSYSRLGIDYQEFLENFHHNREDFSSLEGLHFHALFQSSFQGLEILLEHITQHYQAILPQLKWLNLGGGHNFTDSKYETEEFITSIRKFKERYPHIELYFEPGETVIKGCGDFVCSVLDIITIENEEVAILDTSIETHLLDVAIVNQRLHVEGTDSYSTPYFYHLAGNSCLQGDMIGVYFFVEALEVGSKVTFKDMMGYTMVKMTEFNGMKKANFVLNSSKNKG